MLSNESGVETVKDIKFSQNEKEVHLFFGDLSVTIEKEQLKNPNIKKGLEQLELTYIMGNSGNILLKWRGEKVGEVKE